MQLTTQEVADRTGRTKRTIADWRRGYYSGKGGRFYYSPDKQKLVAHREMVGQKYRWMHEEKDLEKWLHLLRKYNAPSS